jgi:hypothetical protein
VVTDAPKRRWFRFAVIAVVAALIAIYLAGWWLMDVIPEDQRPRPKPATQI